MVFYFKHVLLAAGLGTVVYYLSKNNIISLVQINTSSTLKGERTDLYFKESLEKYSGVLEGPLYLSILGHMFDVSKGRKHYGKGATYHYFVGKDASRAFVTGDFSGLNDNIDHVLDLSCDDVLSLQGWLRMYHKQYIYKGRLVGRYFDTYGNETEYAQLLNNKIDVCALQQKQAQDLDKKYPPCNVEWDTTTGSRVWCSIKSGGIKRTWTGVPRRMYVPGTESLPCVCVKLDKKHNDAILKEYDGCNPTATSCYVKM